MAEAALRRDQRKEATRRALIDAAAELFATRGIDASSLDDIARRVGLTKGAIYANFASKQALVDAVAEHRSVVLDFDEVRGSGLAQSVARLVVSVPEEAVMLDAEWLLHQLRTKEPLDEMPPDERRRRDEAFAGYAERLGVGVSELATALQGFARGVAQELARQPGSISEQAVVTLLARWLDAG